MILFTFQILFFFSYDKPSAMTLYHAWFLWCFMGRFVAFDTHLFLMYSKGSKEVFQNQFILWFCWEMLHYEDLAQYCFESTQRYFNLFTQDYCVRKIVEYKITAFIPPQKYEYYPCTKISTQELWFPKEEL